MTVDRSRPPQAGSVRTFRFPRWEGHRLSNGVRLMVVPQGDIPMVHFEVLLGLGADGDAPGLRGLTALASGLLDEGTEHQSSIEIADAVELLGASLSTTADWDGTYVATSALSMHLEQLFRLSGEIVRSPSFPAEELERSRGLQLSDLANRASRPGFVASRNAANLLFGPEHPYGESLLGTPEGLGSIGLADLESWHRERARPGATTIVAVGDTTLGEIASLAERHFGDWPESIGPAREVPGKPPTAERRRIRIVDRPSAAQTELRVVRVGLSRSSPDYLAARLVSLILGGKFTSRLNLSLREERGITYGVHSRLSGRRGAGPFTVACAVDTEATGVAVGEVIAEFDRLAADPVPETELEDAKNYLLGTFPYRIQTLEGQADHLAEIALHELALDSLETLPEEVRSASAELVGRCARDLLRSDDLAIVAVGPAGLLRPQLEPFGEVELTAENDSSEAS